MKFKFLNTLFSLLFIISFTISDSNIVNTFTFDDDFIEVSESIEKELEEETEEKKEKEETENHKITVFNNAIYSNWFSCTKNRFNLEFQNTVRYFEIPTPPPELS